MSYLNVPEQSWSPRVLRTLSLAQEGAVCRRQLPESPPTPPPDSAGSAPLLSVMHGRALTKDFIFLKCIFAAKNKKLKTVAPYIELGDLTRAWLSFFSDDNK